MEMLTVAGEPLMLTLALADLVESATLFAVTVTVPEGAVAGAL
jgi:hypothetical protein